MGMVKKVIQQGRSRFDARSVRSVRERSRREERQVCEPEGPARTRTLLGPFVSIPTNIWNGCTNLPPTLLYP